MRAGGRAGSSWMEVGKDAAEGRWFYRGGQGRRPERGPPRAARPDRLREAVGGWLSGWGDRGGPHDARLAGHLSGSAAFGEAAGQPGTPCGWAGAAGPLPVGALSSLPSSVLTADHARV
jgi:hypothetical protein